MRRHVLVLSLALAGATLVSRGAAAADAVPDRAEAGTAPPREPPPLHMVGAIPRWPWILAAALVFAGMCVLGLRRRS